MLYTSETLGQLLAIQDLIGTPDRWCQGAGQSNGSGRRCLFEAGGQASPKVGSWISALAAAIMVLYPERADHPRMGTIPAFNDHPLTTHADVLRVVDHAIAHA